MARGRSIQEITSNVIQLIRLLSGTWVLNSVLDQFLCAVSYFVPPWTLVPALMVSIYWVLGEFPLQEIWNPSVRELYPHRQHRSEKALMVGVRGLGWRSRLESSWDRLPAELWIEILELVLHVSFYLDTTCESHDFHLFMESRMATGRRNARREEREQDRRSLRLVCRKWSGILEDVEGDWLGGAQKWGDNARRARRMDLEFDSPEKSYPWPFKFQKPMTEAVEELNAFANLPPPSGARLAIVSLACSNSKSSETVSKYNPEATFSDALALLARRFPSIQTLTVFSEAPLRPVLVSSLPGLFAGVTCLPIASLNSRQQYLPGKLVFPKLKALHLDADAIASHEWSFPVLEHLSMTGSFLPAGGGKLSQLRLPIDTTRLKSLIIPWRVSISSPSLKDGSFWDDYRALEYLSLCETDSHGLSQAPEEHPLAQIRVSPNIMASGVLNVAEISTVTQKVPNLKYLTLPWIPPSSKDSSFAGIAWQSLHEKHCTKGVEWLNEDGTIMRTNFVDVNMSYWGHSRLERALAALWVIMLISNLLNLMASPFTEDSFVQFTLLITAAFIWFDYHHSKGRMGPGYQQNGEGAYVKELFRIILAIWR